jgi:DNA-binding LytR/AlgR family response regulator
MMSILEKFKLLFGFDRPRLTAAVGILVVDDSPGSRNYTTRLIRSFMDRAGVVDYILDVYGSYEEYITGRGDKYDVAFVDWNLGTSASTNGDEVVRSLLDKDSANIVIFSGMEDDCIAISKFAQHNNIDYVRKGDPRQEYKLALAIERGISAKMR